VILPIRIWPDPVLLAVAKPVLNINAALRDLVENMFETMYAAPGRGLAAPQVGISVRVFVMDTTWKEGAKSPRVLINPEIIKSSDDMVVNKEGCLSLPDFAVDVERPSTIDISWQDLNGQRHTEELTGFEAICAQHELDHLNGILTINRISDLAWDEIADVLVSLKAKA
jgi:peptide deformylase